VAPTPSYKAIAEEGPVATLPSNLTFEEAAAGTEGSHYALSFIQKARIESGQDVLVNDATGACGGTENSFGAGEPRETPGQGTIVIDAPFTHAGDKATNP
jgi:hypothetical protein